MDDKEIAYLVLTAASVRDGGCRECVQPCMDEAIYRHPELPWEEAVALLRPASRRTMMTEVLASARAGIADGIIHEVEIEDGEEWPDGEHATG